MIFRFIYQPSEYTRIIPAILIDSRASITIIKNATGAVIKTYTDAEVSKIIDRVLFYKVETDQGVLAGYFSLQVKVNIATHAALLQNQMRPSFNSFVTQISAQITTFINNGEWKQDYLF